MKYKSLVGMFLCVLTLNVRGAVFTDLWWNPNESGWGMNVAQQGGVMFLTFFVYANDGSARWYTATVLRGAAPPTGYSSFTGDMYETRGPWFGNPFNSAPVQIRKVGSATFAPLTPYTANLTYSVDGKLVTKAIQRP